MAYAEVLEQPQSRGYRFGYQNDSLVGIKSALSSDREPRYPAIKIFDYTGRALLIVSCVTKTVPYRAHPCMLRGINCENGVYRSEVEHCIRETSVLLPKLCIRTHSERALTVEHALQKRMEMNVDPFQCGFDHINYAKEYLDLHALRLCFQVFIKGENEECSVPLPPIVSNIIYNSRIPLEKYKFRINVVRFSATQCPADGGTEDIRVSCKEVIDQATQVYFLELLPNNGPVKWRARLTAAHVHKKEKEMWFKPPKYENVKIKQPVNVLVQLRGIFCTCSEAAPFTYLPLESSSAVLQAKSLNPAAPSTSNTNIQPSECTSST